jgi:hypothetical protein
VLKLNHDFLIKTIIDNGGKIRGGYVREWVFNGEPSDFGWEDIDCIFPSSEKYFETKRSLHEYFGNNTPVIDIKCQEFNERKPYSFANDFFCNYWGFNGEFFLLEPSKSLFSYEEIIEMTKNKIARCAMPFHYPTFNIYKIFKMLYYKWNIIDYCGMKIPEKKLEIVKGLLKINQFLINGRPIRGSEVLDFFKKTTYHI